MEAFGIGGCFFYDGHGMEWSNGLEMIPPERAAAAPCWRIWRLNEAVCVVVGGIWSAHSNLSYDKTLSCPQA